MPHAPTDDCAQEFVEQVLRTGLMLTGVAADLIEALPDEAYPGEDSANVIIEMLVGTIRPAVEAAGEQLVRSCIALLAASGERALADLRLAAELAGEREGSETHGGGASGNAS
jgi:hypothetical protein